MIDGYSYSNGRLSLTDGSTNVGYIDFFKQINYSDIPEQKKHVVKDYTGSNSAVNLYVDGSVALLANNEVRCRINGKIIDSINQDVQYPLIVPQYDSSDATQYVDNNLVANNGKLYYLKNKLLPTPPSSVYKFIPISSATVSSYVFLPGGSKNIKFYNTDVYSYLSDGIYYLYDKKDNHTLVVSSNSDEYLKPFFSVFRGNSWAYLKDNHTVTVKNDGDIMFPLTISSIFTDYKNLFIADTSKNVYKVDSTTFEYEKIFTTNIISSGEMYYLNDILTVESSDKTFIRVYCVGDGSYFDVSKSTSDSYIPIDDSTYYIVEKSGASNQRKQTVVQRYFSEISVDKLFKINGRKEIFREVKGFTRSPSIVFSSNNLISKSSTIIGNNIYILKDLSIDKMNISSGFQSIDNNSVTTNTGYTLLNNATSIYGYKDRLYQMSNESKIITFIDVTNGTTGQYDFSGILNGTGIKSMFVSGNNYDEYSILTNNGTVYTIDILGLTVLSTFNVQGYHYDTQIVEFFDNKILATNLYSPTRSIYEVDRTTGEKSINAYIVLPYTVGSNESTFIYNNMLVAYNSQLGEYYMYPREDKVKRVK
jgi:hypothetical protein